MDKQKVNTGRTHTEDTTLRFCSGQVGPEGTEIVWSFDRQHRPHFIVSVPKIVQTQGQREKPSAANVPPALIGSLAKAMFDKAAEISTDLPFKLEFHTGFWASSKCLHAHLIFGTLEYYVARSRYFAERSGPSEPDEVWEAHAQGRAEFVDSYTTKNAGYKVKDGKSIAREIQQPSRRYRSKDLKCAEWYAHKNGFKFILDASLEGCSVISCHFKEELSMMGTAVLTDTLRHSIGMILSELGINDMQIHISPKFEIRFFVPPEPFVTLLRADERHAWFERWSSLPDPVQTAEKSDLALLPGTQAEAEANIRGAIRIGTHATTVTFPPHVDECRPGKKQKGISESDSESE